MMLTLPLTPHNATAPVRSIQRISVDRASEAWATGSAPCPAVIGRVPAFFVARKAGVALWSRVRNAGKALGLLLPALVGSAVSPALRPAVTAYAVTAYAVIRQLYATCRPALCPLAVFRHAARAVRPPWCTCFGGPDARIQTAEMWHPNARHARYSILTTQPAEVRGANAASTPAIFLFQHLFRPIVVARGLANYMLIE